MNINLAASLILGLVLAVALPLPATQPPDARQKLEELGSAMQGTAASTRRRILEGFRRDLDGTVVRFTGDVWTLSSVDLDRGQVDGPDIRPALFSWE